MSTVAIEVPEDILFASGYSREDFAREARFLLALKLFEMGRLSSGKAAELCSMTRLHFLEAVSRAGIPVTDMDDTELAEEFSDA